MIFVQIGDGLTRDMLLPLWPLLLFPVIHIACAAAVGYLTLALSSSF